MEPDEGEDVAPSLRAVLVVPMIDALGLQGMEKLSIGASWQRQVAL
jgi:hypothetical protein